MRKRTAIRPTKTTKIEFKDEVDILDPIFGALKSIQKYHKKLIKLDDIVEEVITKVENSDPKDSKMVSSFKGVLDPIPLKKGISELQNKIEKFFLLIKKRKKIQRNLKSSE